jgi:monovalent cation:H+ antiporter-2, CPA2 family
MILLMELPLLNDIVIIFGLSIAIFFICYRLRLPAIVGFLITGMLAGPHGFKLVGAVHQVEILAEIGVVLLLFTIGIEFSLGELLKIKKAVLLGGTLQVLLTIFVTFLLAKQLGRSTGEAIFLGFLISLSSTAIVLKILQERLEVDSSHGRTCLAILIFQDIAVVPMILLTPFLAGQGENLTKSLLILVLKIAGVLFFVK